MRNFWLTLCISFLIPTVLLAQNYHYAEDLGNDMKFTLSKRLPTSVGVFDENDHQNSRLKNVTILSNGRTYAFMNVTEEFKWEVIPLVEGGAARRTNIVLNDIDLFMELKKNGTITLGDNKKKDHIVRLTGFDASNNPIWASPTTFAEFHLADNCRNRGGHTIGGEITSNGNWIQFNGQREDGYHLGGVKRGGIDYSFKTLPAVQHNFGDEYPTDGTFDVKEKVNNAGSSALAMDDWILWGSCGEDWDNLQTNKWHIYSEKGLYLSDFGIADPNLSGTSIAGMAGNASSPVLVKVNGEVYLRHNDESHHAGLHRWHISDLSSIQEFVFNLN